MHIKSTKLGSLVLFCFILFYSISIIGGLNVQAYPSLHLNFYKDNGYGMGNDLNGLWTVNTEVSSDVVCIEFFLDEQLQLNATAAPFSWSFDTNNFTLGLHDIKAVAYNALGETATSVSQRTFVEFPIMFVIEIIVIVVIVLIVSIVAGIFVARKREAKERLEKTRKHMQAGQN